jgi:dihydroorotase-like cyclic amidohydrolase
MDQTDRVCPRYVNHRSSRVQNIDFPQPDKAEREQPCRRKALRIALPGLVDARTHVKIDHPQTLC